MLTVTIRDLGAGGRVWTSRHRTTERCVALARAVRRHFGRGRWFHPYGGNDRAEGAGSIRKWIDDFDIIEVSSVQMDVT